MIAPKPPFASLATVTRIVGKSELRVAERFADAAFTVATRKRHSIRAIAEVASVVVAKQFEPLVRSRCKRAERAWHWAPSQHKRLGAEIIAAANEDVWLEYMVDRRCVSAITEMANGMASLPSSILLQIAELDHREAYAGFVRYVVAASKGLNAKELRLALDTVYACSRVCHALIPESIDVN